MALNTSNHNIDYIHRIEDIHNILSELQIARVRKNNIILWEYANSNFFSSDKRIIVSSDGFALNGRKE